MAEAVACFIERLHQQYPGLRISPVAPYEDEDFALEVVVPKDRDIEEVEEACHRECIDLEDRYGVYLLAQVKRAD